MHARAAILCALGSALSCQSIVGLSDLYETTDASAACTCTLPNASIACPEGPAECQLVMCDAGFADCNADESDGCELDTAADADNCGRCDRTCLGATCREGRCDVVILAENVGNPKVVAPVGDWVYYSTSDGPDGLHARVLRDPPGNLPTEPEQLNSSPGLIHGVTATNDAVYMITNDGRRVSKGSGAGMANVETLFNVAAGRAFDLVLVDDELFWTNRGTGTISRGSIDGDTTMEIATDLQEPFELVVDDAHIYWTDFEEVALYRMARDGSGEPEMIDSSELTDLRGMGIAQDEDAIYWVASTPAAYGDIRRWDKASETGSIWLQGKVTRSVAVDDEYLWWVDKVRNEILRAPKETGTPVEVMAAQQLSPQGLVIGANAAYWANFSGASIARVAR